LIREESKKGFKNHSIVWQHSTTFFLNMAISNFLSSVYCTILFPPKNLSTYIALVMFVFGRKKSDYN